MNVTLLFYSQKKKNKKKKEKRRVKLTNGEMASTPIYFGVSS
jgi:hypothetical protein